MILKAKEEEEKRIKRVQRLLSNIREALWFFIVVLFRGLINLVD